MNSTWHWLKRNGCFFPEVCSGVNHWRAEDCGELSKEISTIASCPLYNKEHSQTVLTQILITLKFLCKDVWKIGLQHCLKSIKNENKYHISNYSLSIMIVKMASLFQFLHPKALLLLFLLTRNFSSSLFKESTGLFFKLFGSATCI